MLLAGRRLRGRYLPDGISTGLGVLRRSYFDPGNSDLSVFGVSDCSGLFDIGIFGCPGYVLRLRQLRRHRVRHLRGLRLHRLRQLRLLQLRHPLGAWLHRLRQLRVLVSRCTGPRPILWPHGHRLSRLRLRGRGWSVLFRRCRRRHLPRGFGRMHASPWSSSRAARGSRAPVTRLVFPPARLSNWIRVAFFDTCDKRVCSLLKEWLGKGHIWLAHFGTPCTPWSAARTTGSDTAPRHPQGLDCAWATLDLLRCARRARTFISIENPFSSSLWKWPPLLRELERHRVSWIRTDYCCWGAPYQKATYVLRVQPAWP